MYGVISAELINGSRQRYDPRPRPWVAHLSGLCPTFGFKREFIKGVYDYTYARKTGSRGVYVYFAIPPGLYEVYYPTSWKYDKRYFIRVEDTGEWHRVEREEVLECLKNDT